MMRFQKSRRGHALRAVGAACLFATFVPAPAQQTTALKKPNVPTARVTKPKLYVVGYSHLDTQWCWTYPQVIREFIPNTLHENFALFEKYPSYVFNWTGSNRYRFMKEYYPEDYATLKKYVAKERWFPAGSSIEEGDVNSPSEESLIRQVMYGNQFFRREFGKASNEYMLPDCFGFPASLPSILAHCGIKGFSTQKLTWGSAVGIPFNVGNWVGPDGRSIVAALNAGDYTGNVTGDISQSSDWEKRLLTDQERSGVPVDYRYYGVGDRGGAPREDSVRDLGISEKGDGPLQIIGGDADAMFNALTPDQISKLPSYKGDLELTQHSAGSLSSEAAMKRWNRKNELLADDAERASVAADWLGAQRYDKARLTDAWLRFLPGQFHDLMAGTALPKAYNYTWNDEVIAMNEFADVLQSSVGGVTRGLDTRSKGVSLVVYNPLSISREDVVEASVVFPGRAPNQIKVTGPNGEVPSQIVERKGSTLKILVLARVPSIGFESFDVQAGTSSIKSSLHATHNQVDNRRYRVTFNRNADVASIYDKVAKHQLLSGPARLAFQYENPGQYPSWNMDWNDQKAPPRGYVSGPAKVEVVENGPVRVAIRVTRHSEGSTFVQTIRLAAGDAGNRVEYATKIDWQSKECALKAVFPLAVSNPKATYNWGLGTVQRGNNDPKKYEVASHEWFDVTGTDHKYGVSVLEDCKYGSDKPDDSTVRLTLIYTPGVRAGFQHQGSQDQGRNTILYALSGHSGDWRKGKTQWEAARLNQPLVAFQAPSHDGSFGKQFSLAHTTNPNVSIEALKKAEDSNEVVVRLNELAGKAATHCQVVFSAPVISAREIDGQERPLGAASIENGHLIADMSPYRPRAFAVRVAGPAARLHAPQSQSVKLPYNSDGISTWESKTDGNFDGQGDSLPGELMPKSLVSDAVTFRFGPKTNGADNAVSCAGQRIALPLGSHRKLYFLASSTSGDVTAAFGVGGRSVTRTIQAWDGYVGQWDNRSWGGAVPELTYDWHNPLVGLVPGYIKRAPVAWYADHRRLKDGSNDIYSFCYLFRYSLDIPDGVRAITLPRDERVKIVAASISQNPNDDLRAAQPLYDVLEHKGVGGPTLTPTSGNFSDTTSVAVGRPMYWKVANALHYTLDGSDPTASSLVCTTSIKLNQTATVRVAQIDSSGNPGPITTALYVVNDTTPPRLVSATAMPQPGVVRAVFSEEVDKASAEDAAHYTLDGGTVESASLESDGKTVVLHMPEGATRLTATGVAYLSPNANKSNTSIGIAALKPVFEMKEVKTFSGQRSDQISQRVPSLPVKGGEAWTINMFVYMDKQPAELTVIGGFGDTRDTSGAERYLVKFQDSIEFWGSNVDIVAGQAYETGRWQMISLTYDGKRIHIYKDARELASEAASLNDAEPLARFGVLGPWGNRNRFVGKIAGVSIWNQALPPEFLQGMLSAAPGPT